MVTRNSIHLFDEFYVGTATRTRTFLFLFLFRFVSTLFRYCFLLFLVGLIARVMVSLIFFFVTVTRFLLKILD